jgi:outer membrane immunogenic protein
VKILQAALLGATVLIGAAAAANAADVYDRKGSLKDAPDAYLPAITWTGFYVGANVGGLFVEESGFIEINDYKRKDFEEDDTLFIGGIHVGYNWQKPSGWLFGIEGDVGFADDIDYLATIRGRLGYAMGPTLVYATGGAAFIGLDNGFDDDSETETGWVVGAGIEHKFSQNWSIGLEGLYYNFGNGEDFTVIDGKDSTRFHFDDSDLWTVRARLTYHFGGRDDEPLK